MIAALSIGGLLFSLVSVFLILRVFAMPTTVPASPDAVAFLPPGMTEVVNFEAMHYQALTADLGIAAGIIAAIFFGAAAITTAISKEADHHI